MGSLGESRSLQGHAGKQSDSFVLPAFSSCSQIFPEIFEVFVFLFWKGEVDEEALGKSLM
jgi:hypothetical protein